MKLPCPERVRPKARRVSPRQTRRDCAVRPEAAPAALCVASRSHLGRWRTSPGARRLQCRPTRLLQLTAGRRFTRQPSCLASRQLHSGWSLAREGPRPAERQNVSQTLWSAPADPTDPTETWCSRETLRAPRASTSPRPVSAKLVRDRGGAFSPRPRPCYSSGVDRTVQVFRSFDDAERADDQFYADLTPEERLDMLLELVERQRSALGEAAERFERVHSLTELSRR